MAALPKTFLDLEQFVCDLGCRMREGPQSPFWLGWNVKAAVTRRRDSSSEAQKQEVVQLYENEEGFMVLTSAVGAVGAVRAVRAVRATLFMF